jgi:putative FmdB family regulatory protein
VPTYDYQCRSCSRVIEVIHPMTEDGPSVCEACGGALRRVLFPAGIIFKGSGFYRTDSRAGSDTSTTSPKKAESGPTGGADGGSASTGSTGAAGSGGSTGSTSAGPSKKTEAGSSSSD